MSRYRIQVVGSDRSTFTVEPPGAEGYVIGRSDDVTQYAPDIDLSNYEAREKGVSRRHAALVRFQGKTHAVDLNSVNGTYLNGRRLAPDKPEPLDATNELRLGTLVLAVSEV
jgi:pSer/pThr/pTyr-binding forkhead associated (FHA) protein